MRSALVFIRVGEWIVMPGAGSTKVNEQPPRAILKLLITHRLNHLHSFTLPQPDPLQELWQKDESSLIGLNLEKQISSRYKRHNRAMAECLAPVWVQLSEKLLAPCLESGNEVRTLPLLFPLYCDDVRCLSFKRGLKLHNTRTQFVAKVRGLQFECLLADRQ